MAGHNSKNVDFGIAVRVIFSGVGSGKSSFLEEETDDYSDEYYGYSSVDYKGWRVAEQDTFIIDDQSECICRYIKMTADCFKRRKTGIMQPLVILAATNYNCWKSSFKETIKIPHRFYHTKEWYEILEKVFVDADDLKNETEEMSAYLQRENCC